MSRRMKIVSGGGSLLVAAGAYAATNWVVGLSAGSSAEAQSATIANLSITAVASPAAGNLLYPGSTGDVVVTIANPNPYPVTISAVQPAGQHRERHRVHDQRAHHHSDRLPGHDPERRHVELRHGDQRQLAHA